MNWLPIIVVLAGNIVYHLGQRAIPREANPVAATLAAYLVATLGTLATIPWLARDVNWKTAWSSLNASTLLVGCGIVAVEIGFLLAYRAGWQIGTASLTANASLAIILLGIGALFFREPVSAMRVAGVVACLCGLWLITRR